MMRIDIPTVIVVTGIIPSFRGTDSYLAFPTLVNYYLELNIEVHFKPETGNGIIFLNIKTFKFINLNSTLFI